MLAVLGIAHLFDDIYIIKAFQPYYAVELLATYPKGFWILGAVFLCTTGAEALYRIRGIAANGTSAIPGSLAKTLPDPELPRPGPGCSTTSRASTSASLPATPFMA